MGRPTGTGTKLGSTDDLGQSGIEALIVTPQSVSDMVAQLGLTGEDAAQIKKAVGRKQVDGTTGKNKPVVLSGGREVLLVGCGYGEGDGWRTHQTAGASVLDAVGHAVQTARGMTDITRMRIHGMPMDTHLLSLAAESVALANHVPTGTGLVTAPEGTGALEFVDFRPTGDVDHATALDAMTLGTTIGRWQNWGRNLVHLDSTVITPEELIGRAMSAAQKFGDRVTIDHMTQATLNERGYDLCLAVNRASHLEAHGVVMEYRGCPDSTFFTDIIGKGVTKDAGGEALKPAAGSLEMHMDMGGSATAMAIFLAIVELGLKVNVRLRVVGVRNMLGPNGYGNGDRVTSRILDMIVRIFNTDAEGRLVLADQIAAARKAKSGLIVDYATLTGAAVVALKDMSAVFSSHQELARQYVAMAMAAADPAWHMPFNKGILQELLDSADGATISNSWSAKPGGATRAAEFLAYMAKGTPQLHVDTAPQMSNGGGKDKGCRVAGGEAPQVSPGVRLFKAISDAGQDTWARETLGWAPAA